jgi:hypothetical protein
MLLHRKANRIFVGKGGTLMGKYDPLYAYLKGESNSTVALSFSDIERVMGAKLPVSARKYDWWWDDEDRKTTRHVQSVAWTTAGFAAEVDRQKRQVTFRRTPR